MIKINRPLSEKGAANMKCDRRLYLTSDKARVVEEGDVSAGYLFASPGNEIPEGEASRYGLECRDGKVVLPGAKPAKPAAKPEPEPKPEPAEPKAAKKSEDKSMKKSGDKSASSRKDKAREPE